jgi:uncharacterized YigZ family protein
VEQARAFIQSIRAEMPDATHHVYAFKVGYGGSITEGMSDDGEPSGTSGPPVLAVLRGASVGNVVLVVTRYFGGTKLGIGGLVRAYGDAVRAVLAETPRAERVPTHTVMLVAPYNWFERLQLLIAHHGGQIVDQEFAADVTLTAEFPTERYPDFRSGLQEASHGSLDAEIIETRVAIVPIGGKP